MGFGLHGGSLCMQAVLDWGGNPWLERAGVTPGSVWQGGDTEAQWGALWSAYSGQPPSERADTAQAGPLGGQGLAVIPMDLGVSMRPVPARGGCGHGCLEDRRQQGPWVRRHPAWWGRELLRPPLQGTPIPQPMRLEGHERLFCKWVSGSHRQEGLTDCASRGGCQGWAHAASSLADPFPPGRGPQPW